MKCKKKEQRICIECIFYKDVEKNTNYCEKKKRDTECINKSCKDFVEWRP